MVVDRKLCPSLPLIPNFPVVVFLTTNLQIVVFVFSWYFIKCFIKFCISVHLRNPIDKEYTGHLENVFKNSGNSAEPHFNTILLRQEVRKNSGNSVVLHRLHFYRCSGYSMPRTDNKQGPHQFLQLSNTWYISTLLLGGGRLKLQTDTHTGLSKIWYFCMPNCPHYIYV